jgi:hypothetical protein
VAAEAAPLGEGRNEVDDGYGLLLDVPTPYKLYDTLCWLENFQKKNKDFIFNTLVIFNENHRV